MGDGLFDLLDRKAPQLRQLLGDRTAVARLGPALALGLERLRRSVRLDDDAIKGQQRRDLLQVGGYTAARKVAAMAEGANFPIVTHLLPEYSVHLGAGVPNGLICEHKEWLWPLFDGLPVLKDGEAFLSERPGQGLALAPAYRDIF